ncbi:MAG: 30S ribosomal protein S4 [Candidatus Omnitrophica bacterium]|nr:30S ribosomal protein S4 [Candidatus Omnitrophota bacterium]
MARYTGPRFRLCRREGVNLFGNKKFDIEKRPYPPGQHGNDRRMKLSDYGLQLREKQKVKRIYGVLERQFRRYYEKAARSKGVTGSFLLQLLERRLDNVIYRLGFATTRPQARQIVSHGMVQVNGRRVNIPSFLVKEGEEITLAIKDKSKKYIDGNIEANEERPVPAWLNVDVKNYKATVVKLPQRDDVQFPINEQLIVELYSK